MIGLAADQPAGPASISRSVGGYFRREFAVVNEIEAVLGTDVQVRGAHQSSVHMMETVWAWCHCCEIIERT